MVRVLLDTCVISELQRPDGHAQVRARVEELDPDALFLSVITVGELSKGVALLPDGRRKQELRSWLTGLEQRFTDRILEINGEIARLWGEVTAKAQQQGVQIPVSDGLIAATALRHGLTVMTRNTKHFSVSGAQVFDPWNS